jgi:hypothetical protein
VITYRMDGPMLILTKSGRSTPQERAELFEALRGDPAVPNGALLLLDLRQNEEPTAGSEFGDRLLGLRGALGLKLGPACAVVVHDQHDSDARALQEMPATQGLRLVMFTDEAVARGWLSIFAPPPTTPTG